MNKVIIFGGTTEGRRLAEFLADNDVVSIYCVATEYGKEPIKESGCIHLHSGRMDASEMLNLYECERPDAIIDATHPFATVVKEEIENSLSKYETVPFFRLLRDQDNTDVSNCTFFDSALDCARALSNTTGNIFLTTGSKDLATFCQNESVRERIIARIIPNDESLEICKNVGLKGNQIVAMQGPFSKRMNMAFLKEYDAKIMVLKESGKAGGEADRIEAANTCGVKCFIIKRPEEKTEGYTFEQVVKKIFDLFGLEKKMPLESTKTISSSDIVFDVTLAGFGMGLSSMTEEVKKAIEEADFIFGAPRMLVGVDTKAKKYPFYLAKDIIPCLQELVPSITFGIKKVIVLFSGDTGFYSGATKLEKELIGLNYCKVRILPGISSVSAIASRAHETWQDGKVLSTHGILPEVWEAKLIDYACHNQKTFAITSGSKDIRRIGELLLELEKTRDFKFRIFVGNNLYSVESTEWLTAEKCYCYDKDGLCSILVINDKYIPRPLAPGLKDEIFLRDKVPMSKEEIRALSICKLRPTKDAVIYDIGSGSGSVAVELGLLDPTVNVYAIELKHEAYELIKSNVEKFMLKNVQVIEGTAPEALEKLPAPTHVFIGGSAGRLDNIIDYLRSFNLKMRIVINFVTMETMAEVNEIIKKYDIDADIAQVSVSKAKKIGDYTLMQGQNPVYIVTMEV